MTVRDKIVANGLMEKVLNGDFVVTKAVSKSDKYEAVMESDHIGSGDVIYMRTVELDEEITEDDRIFFLGKASWRRLEQSLWMQKDEQNDEAK